MCSQTKLKKERNKQKQPGRFAMSLKEKKEEELASQQICSEEIDSGKQWQGSEEIRQQNYSKAARS